MVLLRGGRRWLAWSELVGCVGWWKSCVAQHSCAGFSSWPPAPQATTTLLCGPPRFLSYVLPVCLLPLINQPQPPQVVSEEEEEDDSEQQDEQQGAGGSAAKAAGAAAGGKKGGGMSKAKAAEAAAAARLGQQLNL